MSRAKIIEEIFSKPIEHLLLKEKKLSNAEVIRLYREVYKFAAKFYWNNDKGQPWKEGVIAALGINATPAAFWKHVLGKVTSWKDLETPLLGAVEEFLTTHERIPPVADLARGHADREGGLGRDGHDERRFDPRHRQRR